MNEGDKVRCVETSIDKRIGEGLAGVITGFTRFSSHHPLEAMVRFDDGRSDWFWLRSLEAV